MDKILWLVIPCYNEEAVLPDTAKQLKELMYDLMSREKISGGSRIVFTDDGSGDRTWEIIQKLCGEDPVFGGIRLSRNRGHQNALLCGLMAAKDSADIAISLDADLQDDISVIEEMLDQYEKGNEIVYGVRSSRKKDSFFKRFTAQAFYKFLRFMGVEIVYNHADFRLMSKKALDALSEFDEVNLFLRGMVPQLGYPSCTVEYERKERTAGESKYPLSKMLSLAGAGITSFSVKPLRVSIVLGGIAAVVCVAMVIYCIVQKFCGNTVSGWASLGVSIWGLGALQLLMLGIVGEYIGKIYLETKHRPKYIVEETVSLDSKKAPE